MSMRQEYKAKIVSKEYLNEDTLFFVLECPDIAAAAVPGQFVNISCDKFLKRPFGIASADKDKGTVSVGVKIIGEGTKNLSELEAGDIVDILGPLGNGFDIESYDSYILAGGGTGVFPLNFAYETLTAMGKEVATVFGFRDRSQVIMEKDGHVITTDAGDYGIKGTVIAGLDSLELKGNPCVLVVGPTPMMRGVGEWARSLGLKCFVSTEQHMACGVGICLVCVCRVKSDNPEEEYKHVRCCKDGPVFDYEEVIL
ncbi:MAG: dihydroorotate dehydrogenase electron transfer subunit [Clostridiales bacterium]|nr:dihydroorotate dehydrogenase electron transfer subunit [Clostridiales bacterium]